MKRFITFCLLCFASVNFSFAEPLKQFQTFSWKKVAKAKKYEIQIEKQLDKDSYESAYSEQLTDNHLELLLYPGNYRVAVSVFNVLGRKTSTTPWTNFIILDETEPYLYSDSFKESKRWKSPVLNVKTTGVQIIQEENDEGEISAREGDPTNSFFIKGKNIFFEETTFSLVPKAAGKFEAFVENRPEVPLTIVRRDTENSGVVVEYDPESLFSGYYDIHVKNPGEKETSLEILVLSYRKPEIDVSSFEYNENYKVHVLNVNQGKSYNLVLSGTGFDNSSVFSLSPDSSLPAYPFASAYNGENQILHLTSHKSLDDKGTVRLSLNVNTSSLYTGYYKFTVNNGNNSSDSEIFLINVLPEPENKPEITKIKTKNPGLSDKIQFNINSLNIDKNSNLTLVSSYSNEKEGNDRIPVYYLDSKKKGKLNIFQCSKENLGEGNYVLLVENGQDLTKFYFNVDAKFNFNPESLTEAESTSIFYKPENVVIKTKSVKIEPEFITGVLRYYRASKTYRPVLSGMHIGGNLVNFPGYDFNGNNIEGFLSVDLLDFQWLRLDAGAYYYNYDYYDTSGLKFGGDLTFGIPNNYLAPFIGAGYYTTKDFDQVTVPVKAGIRFANFLDFTYELSLENFNTSDMYVTDKYSLDVRIPLSAEHYKWKVKATYSRIAEPEIIDGNDYIIKKNTTDLRLDSLAVKGFEGMSRIVDITLSNNVQTIEEKAFANMKNLTFVTIGSGLNTIKTQAFLNDSEIKVIRLPETVVKIEKNAFAGWNKNQTIRLQWFSDDETPRELSGLDNTAAYIIYLDGVEYEKN